MGLFQRFWKKIISQTINESMDNAYCKTGPATAGLLMTWILKDPLSRGRREKVGGAGQLVGNGRVAVFILSTGRPSTL